jgi:PAS domain S-box-containing protein
MVAAVVVAAGLFWMRSQKAGRRAGEAALARLNPEIDARVEARTAALTHAMEESRRSSELLQGLFTRSGFAIVALDADYRVVLWNPAAEQMFGVPAAEVLGRQGPFLASPPDQARELDPRTVFERAARGERLHNLEVRRLRPDGTPLDLRVSTVTLYTTEGQPRGIVEIIEDVTERRRLDQQLAQAQKMEAVGQLTGGVAHDFNNLLAAIVGNLDMLSERLEGDPGNARLVRLALDAALRGANLTRQLLAFSRRQPLTPQVVELNGVIRSMDELLHRTLGGANEIQSRLEPSLWRARVDPTGVETAVLNLALNARDAMPKGGRLIIETANVTLDDAYAAANQDARPGEYVMLSVSDNGSGMPADVLARAFEPFFTTKEPGRGSGLGLSMVYGFARQSGGHVKIYSESGHGTTVRLYLPRDRSVATATGPAVMADTSAVPGRGETVLVVEDSPSVRETAASLIQSLGYRVLTADRAQSALDLLDAGTPVDLLFTDIIMPGGVSGVDLARIARDRRPGLKVLFTTGFAEDVLGPGASGDGPMLVKPYQRHQLARQLRRLLD